MLTTACSSATCCNLGYLASAEGCCCWTVDDEHHIVALLTAHLSEVPRFNCTRPHTVVLQGLKPFPNSLSEFDLAAAAIGSTKTFAE